MRAPGVLSTSSYERQCWQGQRPRAEAARCLERLGLAGLAKRRPAWEVVVSQAPEPRWTGANPRLMSLKSAYRS